MAKNTGKTRTLVALLEEFGRRGRVTGVTSVGRDGEDHDVIDPRVAKPRVPVPPGGLVATTEPLLRRRGVEYEILLRTGVGTPLGRAVICRLPAGGAVEIAGPSSSADTARVCEAMLGLGADNVLIDGAINRRAAAAPAVADAVVLATGAALHPSQEEVVARTLDAAELFGLARTADPRTRAAAEGAAGSIAVLDSGALIALDRSLTLAQAPHLVTRLFTGPDAPCRLIIRGALCEDLVVQVHRAARGRPVSLVAEDGTRVFLAHRTATWFARRGVSIEVLRPSRLAAITINPVAPGSHRLDSSRLREQIAEPLEGVLVCDVAADPD
ncbi:hypothetical protein ACQEU3_02245 [Spirillospora sp. CA-253888]